MAIPDVVRDWFAKLTEDGATETPEPIGEGEDPTTETVEDDNPEPTDDPETPVDENTDVSGDGNRTAPEPASEFTDAEREAMNSLAGENEALRAENADLRTRIAELGGDSALGIVEEVIEDVVEDDPEDEYDPDADIADQEAELARLRGE